MIGAFGKVQLQAFSSCSSKNVLSVNFPLSQRLIEESGAVMNPIVLYPIRTPVLLSFQKQDITDKVSKRAVQTIFQLRRAEDLLASKLFRQIHTRITCAG
jgi:hypothetical protein